jgi:hypothetical protein
LANHLRRIEAEQTGTLLPAQAARQWLRFAFLGIDLWARFIGLAGPVSVPAFWAVSIFGSNDSPTVSTTEQKLHFELGW